MELACQPRLMTDILELDFPASRSTEVFWRLKDYIDLIPSDDAKLIQSIPHYPFLDLLEPNQRLPTAPAVSTSLAYQFQQPGDTTGVVLTRYLMRGSLTLTV